MDEVAALAPTTDSFESSTTTLEQAGLDRDAFLTIFLTQLQYQDPLDPQDSSELSAQLATFSQLEQSVVQVNELRDINDRLEQLIEAANRSQTPPTLDPVSLIGRNVEVGTEEVFVPQAGSSLELGFELERADMQFLNVVARDASGELLGLASLAAGDADPETGQEPTFAPGQYSFALSNEVPQLQQPGRDPVVLGFLPLVELPNGEFGVDLDPNAEPPEFFSGASYRFEMEWSNNRGQRVSMPTTTSGQVTSVRIVDGLPVLVIGGQDIDPSRIIRIQ
ncbi:MAG: flagellar hook capping FlgD N-terminal domain-containing protein [Myxococcota bacterium]